MMVNMGAATTLLMKKWVDMYDLLVKEKAAEYISGANGTSVRIVGMTSITFLLMPTLEMDMVNIAICLCDFY